MGAGKEEGGGGSGPRRPSGPTRLGAAPGGGLRLDPGRSGAGDCRP